MIYTIILKEKPKQSSNSGTDNSENQTQEKVSAIISLDCVKSFSETRSATVTNLTVEKGFNISDNMNIEPTQFTLDGVISSYSLLDDNSEIIWNGRKFTTKNGDDKSKTYNHARIKQQLIDFFTLKPVFSLLESEFDSNNENVDERYKLLKTGYSNEYENCVLTGMDFSVPESSSEVFYVSMKIQQVSMAYVESRQLTTEEQKPALTRYTPEPVEKSSSVSSTDSTQGDKSDAEVGGQDGDLVKTINNIEKDNKPKPEKSPYDDGTPQFEVGVQEHNRIHQSLESQVGAYRNATNAAWATGRPYEVVPYGSGYKSQPSAR